MPRPRPSRPPVSPSSASAPVSPTSRRRPTSSRPPKAACADPRNHRYSPAGGLPELKAAVAEATNRHSGTEVTPAQVLVTNGGKHAVYNAFEALLNPGDEVLLPAPFWTTYPEPIALAGGTTVVLPTGVESGFRVSVEQLEAARTPDTKALVFVSPSNPTGAVYPRRRGAGHRRVGRRARHLGAHRRDLRVPHLRRPRLLLDARAGPGAGRHVRDPQRGGQDLRHDRLAGRVDDRPGRRGEGGHQPAVALHVQRGQRLPARRPGRPRGWPGLRRRDASGVRPSGQAHPLVAERDPRCHRHGAPGRLLRVPLVRGGARPVHRRGDAHVDGRVGRRDPRRGQGGHRPGRGVRRARATPACRSPSATTTSSRASGASPTSCSR